MVKGLLSDDESNHRLSSGDEKSFTDETQEAPAKKVFASKTLITSLKQATEKQRSTDFLNRKTIKNTKLRVKRGSSETGTSSSANNSLELKKKEGFKLSNEIFQLGRLRIKELDEAERLKNAV